jgi:membrane-anchored protein YejM (alkaline phosphatase superfamily)
MYKNLKNKSVLRQFYIVFLFNFITTLFISRKYFSFLEDTDGFLTTVFLVVSTFSHFLIISAVPLLISFLIQFIFRKTFLSLFINVLLSVIGLLYIQLDTILFGQFRYHISPMVLKMAFGKRATDIFQFSTQNIVMAVLFVVVLILLQFLFHFIARKIEAKNEDLKVKQVVIAFVMCTLFGNIIYAWSDANYYGAITQTKEIFPVYFPLTADNLMHKLGVVDLERTKNKTVSTEKASNTISYPLQPLISQNSTKKNIIYIVIDTWRWDCMTPEITPNIYNFSKKSMVFDNHRSGSNMTTGGIFSLFYGIPATYFYTFTTQQIPPVFMDELQKQQYDFHVFASSTLENPLFTDGKTPAERDLNINKLFISTIEKQDTKKPFFGFLFYDAAHGFDYPENYNKPFLPDLDEVNYLDLDDDYNPKLLINRYKNSLHFVDSLVGNVLNKLEEKNLLENSIIVITSDHGQEFNDLKKGYWQHGGNFSDYQIKVPMLIFDASKTHKIENKLTTHYDIVPTILSNYLGVKNKFESYSFGENLFAIMKNRDYFICGYNQKFSIIEATRITTISPSGTLEVMCKKLNKLDDKQINYNLVLEGIQTVNKFYKKK